jgi:hypothetical protein
MDWTRQLDGYCERLAPGFWSEPLNAVTNLAFIIAALIMWRRSIGVAPARLLCGWLFAIGLGSFLFHTFATPWAAMADVVPIFAFVVTYIVLVNRNLFGFSRLWSGVLTVVALPAAALIIPVVQQVPILQVSAGYMPVLFLIVIYAVIFAWQGRVDIARGFAIGAGILFASLWARSLDLPLCGVFPQGSHLFWHCLNGLMLGWMIEVYLRARRGNGAGSRPT